MASPVTCGFHAKVPSHMRDAQGGYKARKGQATSTKTAKKMALKKESPKHSTKKQAKRKSYFLKALTKTWPSHKGQHRK